MGAESSAGERKKELTRHLLAELLEAFEGVFENGAGLSELGHL